MMAAHSGLPGIQLAVLLDGLVDAVLPDIVVSGLATDSRQVRPGDLFLACEGLNTHAIRHVHQALSQGAAAVAWEPVADAKLDALAASIDVPLAAVPGLGHRLGIIADRFFAHPSQDLHTIGVTGTDGKTSVTHFIAQALSSEGSPCGLIGTLGYGVYGQLEAPTHTTPDALRLQAELARLRDAGVQCVAMEASSHALHQRRTDGVRFNTAILTHLSRDHLDYHGSIEAYAEAKRRLFLSAGLETAVLNISDEFGRQLAHQLGSKLRLVVYGKLAECAGAAGDWIGLKSVIPGADGLLVELETSRGAATIKSRLMGLFNASNLMAALGGLLAAGLSLDDAAARLSQVTTVAGRMELVEVAGAPRVVIDYAHTPHALQAALQALRPHCRGRLLCLFGAGGDRDSGKRAQMGAVAEQYADKVMLTSDNPRGEAPAAIIEAIAAGFQEPERAVIEEDRAQAIASIIAEADSDDLVLVAGKGHETYQQIGDRKLPFSDREQVRLALRGWGI